MILDCLLIFKRPMILTLLTSHGFQCIDCGIAKDTLEEHKAMFKKAFSDLDVQVIVTTGGVSMGDRDFVKDTLVNEFNAKIHFGRVFMKPGKPTVFATVEVNNRKLLIFSLPGNPVSALVTSNLYVLPSLRCLSGLQKNNPAVLPTIQVVLAHDFELDPRPEYHRVRLISDRSSGQMLASSTGANQASSRISSATSSDDCAFIGIVALPARSNEQKIAKSGSILPCHPLSISF